MSSPPIDIEQFRSLPMDEQVDHILINGDPFPMRSPEHTIVFRVDGFYGRLSLAYEPTRVEKVEVFADPPFGI